MVAGVVVAQVDSMSGGRAPIGNPPESGAVVAIPEVGGLHHRYERRAP